MKPRSLVVSAAVLIPLLLGGVEARADDTALAEALFQDGRRLFKAKKFDEACPKFEESHRLVPKLGTLLNMATCHDKMGKTGSAWAEYTKAVTVAKEAGEQARVDYARRMLEELDRRLSKLVVEVPEPVAGIEVMIDGDPIGRAAWKTPIPLDPGDHEVSARASSYEPWSVTATIPTEPGVQTITVPRLEASEDEGTSSPMEPEPSTAEGAVDGGVSGLAIAGWTLTGVGVVGIGVGSYFGVNTFKKQGDSDAFCDGTICTQEGVDLRDEARTSATISTVAMSAGLAFAAAGLTMVIIDAVSDDEPDDVARGAWLAPIAGGDSYGLTGGAAW